MCMSGICTGGSQPASGYNVVKGTCAASGKFFPQEKRRLFYTSLKDCTISLPGELTLPCSCQPTLELVVGKLKCIFDKK